MRKSIFLTTILALFSLFIGLEQASAQATKCDGDKNNHKVGIKHSYEVAIDDGNTTKLYDGDGVYTWYITSNTKDLLKKDAFVAGASPSTADTEGVFAKDSGYFKIYENDVDALNSDYNSTATGKTKNKLSLEWKPEALTKKDKFYLVLNYKENNGSCEANNIKVLKINPINTFKLAISAATETGTPIAEAEAKVCAANVSGAKLIEGKVQYVYGETVLYYLITPSGFTGKWKPTISLPDLSGKDATDSKGINRTYKSVQWAKVPASGSAAVYKNCKSNASAESGATQEFTAADVVSIDDSKTDGSNNILVKVTISNGTYEGKLGSGTSANKLINETLELKVKGNMTDKDNKLIESVRDVNDNCEALTKDRKQDVVILARPTITSTSGEFITVIK